MHNEQLVHCYKLFAIAFGMSRFRNPVNLSLLAIVQYTILRWIIYSEFFPDPEKIMEPDP